MSTDTHIYEVNGRSTGDLVRELVSDVEDIIRSEIRLAKIEIKEEVVKAGRAGGAFAGAAVFALFGLAFVLATCAAALAIAIPIWAALLVMGFLTLIMAGALYSFGRTQMKKVHPVPERTVATLKEDVQWVRQRTT